MKILHLNHHLAEKGGVETYLLAVLPLLAEQGVKSIWAYAEGDEGLWSNSLHLPSIGKLTGSSTDRKEIQDVILSLNVDVIHIHNIQNAELIEASIEVCPTIVTTHDYRWICPANTFFFKRTQKVCNKTCGNIGCLPTTIRKHCLTPRLNYALPFLRRIQQMKRGHTLLSHTIAPSPVAAERLRRAGWDDRRISVLPYFCPLPVREAPRALPSRPTISFIGRIAPNKGQSYFIEALGALPEEWQGIMAGDIDNDVAEQLQSEARKHGCADRLLLQPWATRQQVLDIMDSSTVFVFPSLWQETLGIVALEALSRGVPVVATNIVGIGHWLQSRRCGRAVPPRNAAAIADAVLEVASSEQGLLTAGQAGIELIQEVFAPGHHTEQLLEVYRQVGRKDN